MSYEKQGFASGDVLYATQLNAMDDQIADNEEEITGLKSALNEIIDTSILYNSVTEVVFGTGTYVSRKIYEVQDISVGDVYTFEFNTVSGNLSTNVACIDAYDLNNTRTSRTWISATDKKKSCTVKSGDVRLEFILYPSTVGATTATYTDVYIYTGTEKDTSLNPDKVLSNEVKDYVENELTDGIDDLQNELEFKIQYNYGILNTGEFTPLLEVGSYRYDGENDGWTKISTKYRVRTIQPIHLKKGDVVTISDFTIGRFYVMSNDDDSSKYVDVGWNRKPYTAPTDQTVVVMLAKITEDTSAVYSDPSEIGFILNCTTYPSVSELSSYYIPSKNLFDAPWLNGYINTSTGYFTEYQTGKTGIATRNYISVDSNSEYTISWYGMQVDASIYAIEYAEDLSFIKTNSYSTGTIGGLTESHVYVLTTSASTKFLRFYILRNNVDISQFTPTNFQLEKGTVATDPVDSKVLNPKVVDYDVGRKRLIDYGVVLNDFYLPDYYFDNSYIQNKAERINALLGECAAYGDAYIFITDEHWVYNQKKSPALLRYLSEHCNILKLFDGGDNADNGSFDFCKKIELAWKKQGLNIYHIAGNHEFFNQTAQSTICYYFDMFHDSPYNGNPEKLYYYVDNKRQKIRYIVLAGYYESETNNNMNGFYQDAEQRLWLRDVALNVDDTWNIVVLTHNFWTIDLETNQITKLGQSAETLAILDAHNADSTKGKILFIQQGHTHRDRVMYTDGGIPIVCTTCDKNKTLLIGGTTPDIHPDVDRTSGTINEQAFDVVIINKTLGKATFIRIGGKAQDGIADDPGDLVEEREVTW